MKRSILKNVETEELVNRYVMIGEAQDQALRFDETVKYNQLFGLRIAIEKELRSRTGDQRRALIPLYEHPNCQVRLNAAQATLEIATNEARKVLEGIVQANWFPQAADASLSLLNLDRRGSHPT